MIATFCAWCGTRLAVLDDGLCRTCQSRPWVHEDREAAWDCQAPRCDGGHVVLIGTLTARADEITSEQLGGAA